MSDSQPPIENWQGMNIKGGQNDIHDNQFVKQQGIIANDQATINIGTIHQSFTLSPTPTPLANPQSSQYTQKECEERSPMFDEEELANLEKNINRLKQQLANKRDALVTIAPGDEARMEQQIEDLCSRIKKLERDRSEILQQRLPHFDLSDAEAEPIVAEWVEKASQLATNPPADVPAEIFAQVQAVAQQAAEPGQSAAIKVKGMISALPPFLSVGVEAELDVAEFWQRNFPTFYKWKMALAKK
jgi:hypothetical protein